MPLVQKVASNVMTTDTKPSQPSSLTQREERDAVLHQRYLAYLAHFGRWKKPKGWACFMANHPLAALVALTKGRELPPAWCRQPMGRDDFVSEIFLDYVRLMSRP